MIDSPEKAVKWLYNNGLDKSHIISMAVVCGSGLAQAIDNYVDRINTWDYEVIPGFSRTTVSGHGGELIIAKFKNSNKIALVFSGRIHLYEGINADPLFFQVRLVKALNIKRLILTCSVGSLINESEPGSLGLIRDQIDFQMANVAVEQTGKGNPVHPVYDDELAEILSRSALKTNIKLTEGIFCSVLGPTYETPAEVWMLRKMGCSWVSMSTTKEAVEANLLGLRTAGITGIANTMKAYYGEGETTHDEVLFASKRSSDALWKLLSTASFDLG